MPKFETGYLSTHQILFLFFIFMLSLFISVDLHAEIKNNQKVLGDRVITLWSDKEQCYQHGAYLISIEAIGDSYKVAACSKYGCRASVSEFGTKSHPINYKNDPRFVWINKTTFETTINNQNKRFYQCNL
jgi:hypothetical protein